MVQCIDMHIFINYVHFSGFSSTPSRHHTPGLLKINGEAEPHMVAMGTAGDQREAPLVQAEVVVQVNVCVCASCWYKYVQLLQYLTVRFIACLYMWI